MLLVHIVLQWLAGFMDGFDLPQSRAVNFLDRLVDFLAHPPAPKCGGNDRRPLKNLGRQAEI
jgi:hypothetical protein